MFFIVTEIQKTGNQKSVVSTAYDDAATAYSAFYSKAAYVPVTTADIMTVTCTRSDGQIALQPVTGGVAVN